MKNKILIVSGDPNSINSEIIFKIWKKLKVFTRKKIYIISNLNLLKSQFKKLNYKIKLLKVNNIHENIDTHMLKVLNVDLKFKNPFNVPIAAASKFIKKSLNHGHSLALKNDIKGLINCSINKSLLSKNNIGVTEYLAKKCFVKNNSEVMLISNNKLAVSPITTHIDINNVSNAINSKIIKNKIKTIQKWFMEKLNKQPKIAILGLNPHNSEFRLSSKEFKIIIPAIQTLKKEGTNINGPFSADTIFISDYKKYDVIVGMYHDQVLSPFKALFKFDAINITLGLKYLRVSPDHGTATDLIGKNKANPKSLIQSIKFINNFIK